MNNTPCFGATMTERKPPPFRAKQLRASWGIRVKDLDTGKHGMVDVAELARVWTSLEEIQILANSATQSP